ncbi:hypothetical protein [Nocardiopsis sp. CC223A]|uniref:hypothetical protein n=1 Tax=Nocardiopsis sp. CC223A TaxID=3044051 RepID=UPI00278C73BA|nr:hypothetical protein [Nocardiopsis sp. CC223A]
MVPWNAARRHFQRIFGKETPKHASGTATATIQVEGFVSGYRGPGPLPSPENLEEFAQAVSDQLREAYTIAGKAKAQFEEEQWRAKKVEKELRAQLAEANQAVDAKMRKAMTDGIHLELFGVALVFAGGVLQVLKLIF